MIFELLEAFQVGKEAGNAIENLYNGEHWDAVNTAYEMAQSLDVHDHYNEGVREILDQLSVVDKNDRDFVKAAAYALRARCYFELGEYAKARQNITACLNIQIDSFTLEKDIIRENQKIVRDLRTEIDKACAPTSQPYHKNLNDRKRKEQKGQKQQKPKQIQNPCTDKSYSRSELLRIIAECCGDNPNQVREDSWRGGNTDTMISNLKSRYGITISKTQANSSSLYKGLIDYIIEHTDQEAKEKSIEHTNITKHSDLPHIHIKSVSQYQEPYGYFNSYVQCTGEFKGKNARFDALQIIIENSSSNIVYGKQGIISVFKFGDYREIGPNNSIKVGEAVRIVIPNLNPQDIKVGANIFVATDYFANKGKEQVGIDQNGDPIWGTIGIEKEPFEMTIVGHFHIVGRGEVVTGTITSGAIVSGTTIYLSNEDTVITARVADIEMSKHIYTYAEKGDNVELLLTEISDSEVREGMRVSSNAPKKEESSTMIENVTSPIPQILSASSFNSSEQEYLNEVKECLADGEIGPRERRLLDKLASKFGISPARAAELEASLSAPKLTDEEKEYYEEVKAVLVDGEISEKEKRLLDKLRKMLNISEERAKEIGHMKG